MAMLPVSETWRQEGRALAGRGEAYGGGPGVSALHTEDPEQPVQSSGGTEGAAAAGLGGKLSGPRLRGAGVKTDRQSSGKEEGIANQVPTYTVN